MRDMSLLRYDDLCLYYGSVLITTPSHHDMLSFSSWLAIEGLQPPNPRSDKSLVFFTSKESSFLFQEKFFKDYRKFIESSFIFQEKFFKDYRKFIESSFLFQEKKIYRI